MEIMSLEQAHYKISALPAWFADFKNRGTLRVGDWADIIVYNQEELGLESEKPVYANDLPGGRTSPDPETHGSAVHSGQRYGDLRGKRLHRSPAGQVTP